MHGAVWLTARVEQMISNWHPSTIDKFTQLCEDDRVLCFQKNGGVKPSDTFRGKKTWTLPTTAPKPCAHSPGSRQRRSPIEKGMFIPAQVCSYLNRCASI